MLLAEIKDKANHLVNQGKLQEARPLWLEICEKEPTSTDNWLILSAIDEHLGFLPSALDHLKYAFHLDAQDQDIWLQSASLNWQMRRFDQALDNIFQGLAIDFTSKELRIRVAGWLLHTHEFEQAILHFNFLNSAKQLDVEESILALSCAYITSNNSLTKAILEGFDNHLPQLELIDQRVSELVSELVLPKDYIIEETDTSKFVKPVAQFYKKIESQLKTKKSTAAQNYFDRMAHTEAVIVNETERTINKKIVDTVTEAFQSLDGQSLGVLEIGCGTGLLGGYITDKLSNITLFGVEFSSAAIAIASKNNSYGHLLNQNQWKENDKLILDCVSCFIIRARSKYFTSTPELLKNLITSADKRVWIIIEIQSNSEFENIKSLIDELSGDREISRVEVDNNDEHYLLCLGNHLIQQEDVQDDGLKIDKKEQLANQLISAQNHYQGIQDYEKVDEIASLVLEEYPDSSQALYFKGLYAQHLEDYPTAIDFFRKALRKNFGYAQVWFQLATVWNVLGRYQSMLRAYKQCFRFAPNYILGIKNLISFYFTQGDWAKVNNSLCQLMMQNPLDLELKKYCDDIVSKISHPHIKEAYSKFYLGKDFKLAEFGAALDKSYFSRCESLLDDLNGLVEDHKLRSLKVNLLSKSGDLQEAIGVIETLISDFPDDTNHLKLKRSLMLSSGNLKSNCQVWEQLLELYQPLDGDRSGGLFVSNYYYFCTDQQIADYHFQWAKSTSNAIQEKYQAIELSGIKNEISSSNIDSRKIRIGYVSGDLKMHSVSMFLYNIYKHHDKNKFEIVSYATSMGGDPMMIKLRLFSDLWRDISKLDDEAAAKMIRRDNINILVDLSGHTGHNRLPLFCFKAASIQGSYLGYANTTGLDEIDFRFSDEVADPTGLTDHLHSENLIRLPNGFLSYSRHSKSPAVFQAEATNTARQYTFVCCNNIQKVNFEVIRVFCEILKRLPSSNILIKAHNFNNPDILARYQQEFEKNGIGLDRIHLMNALDMEDHQELYNHTKIALDPYPYSGTTTTCDALWMGVPVLTYAGSRHSSRVSASILTRVGLEDWIATTEQEYIEKAVSFINSPKLLEEIKLTMRYKMLNSPLMHPTQVCRDIEDAYETMWHKKMAQETE